MAATDAESGGVKVDYILHRLQERVPAGVLFVLLDACSQEADVAAGEGSTQHVHLLARPGRWVAHVAVKVCVNGCEWMCVVEIVRDVSKAGAVDGAVPLAPVLCEWLHVGMLACLCVCLRRFCA